ncbi:Polyribonucleotide nucleotidyltransferase [Porphyridium purpureum]|uniref:Polyribonucleotide nucleotidyltransferase n=1 Tax=Porphyridium purpureum TaxID=35688 RepID=A0A5J4Z692_PORPP|nr:Polyribonucleotide nucleotidyltransferase [Porphyridium purpureum]|eukprot:POR8065..scf295_1
MFVNTLCASNGLARAACPWVGAELACTENRQGGRNARAGGFAAALRRLSSRSRARFGAAPGPNYVYSCRSLYSRCSAHEDRTELLDVFADADAIEAPTLQQHGAPPPRVGQQTRQSLNAAAALSDAERIRVTLLREQDVEEATARARARSDVDPGELKLERPIPPASLGEEHDTRTMSRNQDYEFEEGGNTQWRQESLESGPQASTDDLFPPVRVGEIHAATVTQVVPYGCFVNIGCGRNGLVHISEISLKFVHDIHKFVRVGQQVRVMIVRTNPSTGQFACSIREALDTSLYNTMVWLSTDWGEAYTSDRSKKGEAKRKSSSGA